MNQGSAWGSSLLQLGKHVWFMTIVIWMDDNPLQFAPKLDAVQVASSSPAVPQLWSWCRPTHVWPLPGEAIWGQPCGQQLPEHGRFSESGGYVCPAEVPQDSRWCWWCCGLRQAKNAEKWKANGSSPRSGSQSEKERLSKFDLVTSLSFGKSPSALYCRIGATVIPSS